MKPQIARQVEDAGDSAPLFGRHVLHDGCVVGSLEQRIAAVTTAIVRHSRGHQHLREPTRE